jgi:hypothetical protein
VETARLVSRQQHPTGSDWARNADRIRAESQARRNALIGREALVAEVSAILFEADPMGINYDQNTDEYDSEAETIVLRLNQALGPEDVQRIAHEEFVRWFDAFHAGPPARYAKIGDAIWAAANREAHP